MKLTGHKTPSVFQRYNIVADGDLRTAAHQLRGLTGTKKGGHFRRMAKAKPSRLLTEVGGAARI
jgi:hypothetical protein